MLLAIDIGNTQLFAGLFINDELVLKFRQSSRGRMSSDEYGLFLRNILRENGYDPDDVNDIVISSVVPDLQYSINSACLKYFNQSPLILKAGVKTGLKIQVHNPQEVGADRIANAIAGEYLYPNTNKLIVDFGTATTFCVVTDKAEWRGGLIVPGLRLSMEALESNTAKLPKVEITKPEVIVGRNTIENIQSGLYYSALGMTREVITRVRDEYFNGEPMMVIGTGGFSYLFDDEKLFDVVEPDLVLVGLLALKKMQG